VCADRTAVLTAMIDLRLARDKRISELNDLFSDRRPDLYARLCDPGRARLVHTSAGVVDGVEGLAEVVRERAGGGDDADLDGAAAACGADEYPD
jgi:hypothetical protein